MYPASACALQRCMTNATLFFITENKKTMIIKCISFVSRCRHLSCRSWRFDCLLLVFIPWWSLAVSSGNVPIYNSSDYIVRQTIYTLLLLFFPRWTITTFFTTKKQYFKWLYDKWNGDLDVNEKNEIEGHGFDSRWEDSAFFPSIRLESAISFFSCQMMLDQEFDGNQISFNAIRHHSLQSFSGSLDTCVLHTITYPIKDPLV